MATSSLTLKREIGLIGGISYIVGTVIGSGIYIFPGAVLQGCGNSIGLTLCMWVFSGFTSLCGAICYAELGSRIGKSGGDYTYIKESFGNLFGFLYAWMNLLTRPMSAAIGCMASAEYIMTAVSCSEDIHHSAKTLLTLVILVFVVCLNGYSVKLGSYYQTISTISKIGVLVIIIVAGLIHLGQGHNDNFQNAFNTENVTVLGLSKAFYASYFAYGGFTIPISIILGVLLTIIAYVSTIIAYHAVLTNSQITSDVAVAYVFAQHKLGFFQWVILPTIGLFAAVSANFNVFQSSRLNFVAGRDNLFPRWLSMVNFKSRTPLVSILLLMVTASLVIIFVNIRSILSTYTFLKILGTFLSILSLKRIRKQYPDSSTTLKTVKCCVLTVSNYCFLTAPLLCPVVYVTITLLVCIVFLVFDIQAMLSVTILLGSGAIAYLISTETPLCKISPLKPLNGVYYVQFPNWSAENYAW
ncbi:hypothetical protein LOTGIDRAFT_160167 [Lottia gigantea]|uniref:Amino acid permease/ SLC12A domain-containing protein n=1 Tax=Lottia gigantea TaxID=225164 RepID=V4C3Q7_LOTGI|nr:hypothetical protein LOTGIDRAFT_160167 [Lottia gigantea]ESO96179.1 hypothetical protein LOTGIDRAFT_160167 [Lottia gigantea]